MRCFIYLYMFGTSFSFCQSPKFHIQPQFDEVRPFHSGIAAVRQGNAWGFIDTAGAWVFTPRFVSVALTEQKMYQVTDETNQLFDIQRSPNTDVWSALPAHIENTPIETSSDTAYISKDEERYGRIRFRHNDKYGLMAPDGSIILPASLWRLDIAGRHIACTEGGKLQLYTDRLEKLSDLEFDEVIYLDEQHWLAKITDTGQGTIFDIDGRVVKPDVQLSDGQMMFGRFPVKNPITDKWGYMDATGEAVLPFSFVYTESFWPNGKAVIWNPDPQGRTKKGLIDTSGQLVLPAVYDDILWHPDGIYTVIRDGKIQLLDDNLKPLTQPTGKPLEYIGHGVYVVYAEKKSLEFKKSNWYTGEKGGLYLHREANIAAVYALDGQLLLQGKELAENEPLPEVSEGLAAAKKKGKWGFVRCGKGF